MTKPNTSLVPKWMGVLGEWQNKNGVLQFLGKGLPATAGQQPLVIGVAASSVTRFTEGKVVANVRFSDTAKQYGHTAGIVLGFKSLGEHFYYMQLADTCGFSIS